MCPTYSRPEVLPVIKVIKFKAQEGKGQNCHQYPKISILSKLEHSKFIHALSTTIFAFQLLDKLVLLVAEFGYQAPYLDP